MYRVALADTSNYSDYPTGGQLTSIRNFLKYAAQNEDSDVEFILIGITKKKGEVGRVGYVEIGGKSFEFIPVMYDDNDPNNPQKSVRKGFLKGLLSHRALMAKQKIDLFFIHTPEAYLPLKLFFPTKRFIIFSHGNFYNIFDNVRFDKYKNGAIRLLGNSFLKILLKTSDLVFVLDEQSLKQYSPHCKRVLRVNNSIDTSMYCKEFRDEAKEKVQVLFVGRLSKNKNVDKIVEALSRLEEKFVLDIVGDGEEHEKLKSLINELGLDKRVKLVGKKTQEEVVRYYKKAHILVLNSDKEGLPMVILEAMAAGLCILSTPVGAVGDVIKEDINGYFLDGSAESICINLNKAITNLEKFHFNNVQEAEKYSYKRVNTFILEQIEEKIKQSKKYIIGGQ